MRFFRGSAVGDHDQSGLSGAVLEANEVQAAAHRLGISVVTSDIRSADDIAPGVDALKGRAEALYVPAIRLLTPTAFASILWHLAHDFRRCS